MIIVECQNNGSNPKAESAEPLAAYSEFQADGANALDVDWHACEFDRLAEQTLGGS